MSDEIRRLEELALGPVLATERWHVDGRRCEATLHAARDTETLWLVTCEEDDAGGDWSMAPADDELATVVVDDTLVLGDVAAREVARVEILLGDRVLNLTPNAAGAWIGVVREVELPAVVMVRQLDRARRVIRERELVLGDGPPGGRRLRRTLFRLRVALGLPGRLGLPRRTTSYPSRKP